MGDQVCRGRTIGWWNCGCPECDPSKAGTTTPLKQALQATLKSLESQTEVQMEDLDTAVGILKSMLALRAIQEANRTDPTAETFDVDAVLLQIEEAQARRAALFPTAEAAMGVMRLATERLRDLGWASIEYSPKDGSTFQAYEVGMPVPTTCMYLGDWPSGGWFSVDADDMYPAYPAMYLRQPN